MEFINCAFGGPRSEPGDSENLGRRPKTLTPRELKEIRRSLSRPEIATTAEAKSLVLSRFSMTVYTTTIFRTLRATGMKAAATKKKLYLRNDTGNFDSSSPKSTPLSP